MNIGLANTAKADQALGICGNFKSERRVRNLNNWDLSTKRLFGFLHLQHAAPVSGVALPGCGVPLLLGKVDKRLTKALHG